MLNSCGYNIGNFTLPFIQSFLGPVGVITTSLFDTGNACICLGDAYSVASMVKDGGSFSVAPAFTAEMDGDVGLSSAVNSISIVVSIVIIVGILMVTV